MRRVAKSDAYQNSLQPYKDWNEKLDADMIRHQKSRALETEKTKKQRMIKDAEYQRKTFWRNHPSANKGKFKRGWVQI